MPKKPLWKKRLTVNQPLTDVELEHSLELFDTATCKVTREENGEYYLTACRFDKLSEADEVNESATKLTTIMKAIVKVEHCINHPENGEGSYSGIFERGNDEWHEYVKVKISNVPNVDVEVLKPIVTAQSFYEDGSPMPQHAEDNSPPQENEKGQDCWYRWLISPCTDDIDSEVFDAIYYFAEEASFYSLYKAYETIKVDVDGNKELKKSKIYDNQWAIEDDVRDFDLSANCYGAVRDPTGKYTLRHSVTWCRKMVQAPRSILELEEAESFIRNLMKKWLEWKRS
jgi:hypothetical protein